MDTTWKSFQAMIVLHCFEEKRQRLFPGYAPSQERELIDWVKERLLIPWEEWLELKKTIIRDHPENDIFNTDPLGPEKGNKLIKVVLKGQSFVASLERWPEEQKTEQIQQLFTDMSARYDFVTLLEKSGLNSQKFKDFIWENVWAGNISTDSFSSLRCGLQHNFRASSGTF